MAFDAEMEARSFIKGTVCSLVGTETTVNLLRKELERAYAAGRVAGIDEAKRFNMTSGEKYIEGVRDGHKHTFELAKKAFQEGWSWTRFEREYHNLPTEA